METERSLPLQHQHLFFEDELEAPKPPRFYNPLEKQEILDLLIALKSPIDEHHPCEVLTFFSMDGVLPVFLARPEFAHFSEYLRVWSESKRLIYNDDKDGFASFLRSNWGIIEKLPPIVLLKSICACSAVGCATVLFESGVNLNIDIETQIRDPTEKKLLCKYSLSEAVTEPSIPVEIIKLLFKHGGLPDTLPWSPLFKVLGMISYEHCSDWTPEKSIYKLFHLLCLPELEETFEIIKLLASRTKLVERSVIKLVEEGKFAEVTALLIGARDQLLVPSGEDGGLTNTLVEVELRKELEELKRLTNVEDQRTSNYVFALNFVNSLRKFIDVLHDYRVSPRAKNVSKDEVPFDIAANIVCNTELTTEPNDVYCIDIERLRPKHDLEAEGLASSLSCGKQFLTNDDRMLMRHREGFSWCQKRSFRSFHTSRANDYNIKKPRENQLLKTTTTTQQKKIGDRAHCFSSSMSNSINIMKPAGTMPSIAAQMKSLMGNASTSVRMWTLIRIAKRSIK